jgi:hypothetical protein
MLLSDLAIIAVAPAPKLLSDRKGNEARLFAESAHIGRFAGQPF